MRIAAFCFCSIKMASNCVVTLCQLLLSSRGTPSSSNSSQSSLRRRGRRARRRLAFQRQLQLREKAVLLIALTTKKFGCLPGTTGFAVVVLNFFVLSFQFLYLLPARYCLSLVPCCCHFAGKLLIYTMIALTTLQLSLYIVVSPYLEQFCRLVVCPRSHVALNSREDGARSYACALFSSARFQRGFVYTGRTARAEASQHG